MAGVSRALPSPAAPKALTSKFVLRLEVDAASEPMAMAPTAPTTPKPPTLRKSRLLFSSHVTLFSSPEDLGTTHATGLLLVPDRINDSALFVRPLVAKPAPFPESLQHIRRWLVE